MEEKYQMYQREAMLFGEEAVYRLRDCRVAVFGLGGVGGAAAEAIARCGVGVIHAFDSDTVSITNKNRQLIALDSTVGMAKTEAVKQRIHDIDPTINVVCHNMFFMPDNSDTVDFSEFDYVVDAIDTVTGKIEIIMKASEAGVPIISSMGTGNKLCPTMLEVADIYKTSVCPLARVMRTELRRRGIKKLKVVYSKEEARQPIAELSPKAEGTRRSTPGSCSFVPPVAGYIMASEVIKDLIGLK